MSTPAVARTRPQVEVESHRPLLRLVASKPLTAGRLPFAIFVGSILAVGLVVLLLLHTMAAQDAFRLESLQHESAQLADTQQQLALTEQEREAPTSLAARAHALGMVPTGSIAFVELHHRGKIVGVVQAVPLPAPPAPSPTPSASSSPKPSSPNPNASSKPSASADPMPTGSAKARHHAPRRVTRSPRR